MVLCRSFLHGCREDTKKILLQKEIIWGGVFLHVPFFLVVYAVRTGVLYGENCSSLGTKLEFIRGKTAVHSREDFSKLSNAFFVGRCFFFHYFPPTPLKTKNE